MKKYSIDLKSGQCGKGENMKVLQISTVCGSGSVGRITVDIYLTLKSCGDEGLIAYGRRQAPEGVEAFRFGSDLDMGFHVLSTFFSAESMALHPQGRPESSLRRSENGIQM